MPSTANSTSAELKTPRPKYGEVLALRREEVGFARQIEVSQRSLELAAEATEHFESFSQQWLSRLEADQTGERIDAANRRKLRTLSYLLGWNSFDFEHHVGIPVGTVPGLGEVGENKVVTFRERGDDPSSLRVRIPVYSSIAAGVKSFTKDETPPSYHYFEPDELPKGVNPNKLYLVCATDTSLYEVNLVFPVPEGARLLIETGRPPKEGQLVIAYLPELDIGVIRQHQSQAREVILRSYRVGGPVFWASGHPELRVEGIVRLVSYEP